MAKYGRTATYQGGNVIDQQRVNLPQVQGTLQSMGISSNQTRPGPGKVVVGYKKIFVPKKAGNVEGLVPIYGDAPSPPPAPSAPAAPAPVIKEKEEQIAKLTAQSEAYRKQSEEQLSAAQLKISQLEDEDLQRQKAAELQNRLSIQAAASQARGQAGAQLKIQGASPTTQTAGTSAFKRRRDQMRLAPIQTTAGINAPASSVLNV